MINKISVTTKSNETHVMGVETYARWLCLIEAMEYIKDNAKKNNINMDKSSKWIKPLAFQKYIKERFPSMLHDFKTEENLYIDLDIFTKNSGEHQVHTNSH